MYKEVEIIEKVNNGEKSLSQVYNEIINESKNDIVILIHDDLVFETKNWGEKILKHFKKNNEYGILGLAGTKYLSENGRWWEVSSSMYGIVNHTDGQKKWSSTIQKMVVIESKMLWLLMVFLLQLIKIKLNIILMSHLMGFIFMIWGFVYQIS
jgi:hypothetical protein